MKKVFIDGQAGTTGLQIAQRLSARDDLQLLQIDSAQRKDDAARQALMAAADVTILCLPDTAVPTACELAGSSTRILDASSVHRTHPDWVYGLPELGDSQREAIRHAPRVSNPGCWPQGYILSVRPLVNAGVLAPTATLVYQGVSGYSGGGRPMVDAYQAMNKDETEATGTRSYGLSLQHKHLPEMREFSGVAAAPCFVPNVGTYYQGMLTHVPLHTAQFAKLTNPQQIVDLYQEAYTAERFVAVHDLQAAAAIDTGYLNAIACNGSNRIELMVFASDTQVVLSARYDNLGKGAAGVAVQNLNLMLGMPEQTGLIA